MDHGEIFDDIYRNDRWRGGSGTGSSAEVTRPYREFLHNFLRSNHVRSVLDLGCGDWQFSQHMDWSGIAYLGVDVSKVVLENTRRHARPGVEFRHLNAVTEPLPAADLLIAKDVLQHWSNADILALLPKLRAFRYALITNGFLPGDEARTNEDIPAGMDCRPVDLRRAPFSLPGAYVAWFLLDEPKYAFLWTRPD
ncbi:MAG: class I SAM-dependent methyltransferase [Burkholderiales bacterium]